MEHGCDQFCQVQPDVGDVYGHVFCHLQDFMEPDDAHINANSMTSKLIHIAKNGVKLHCTDTNGN